MSKITNTIVMGAILASPVGALQAQTPQPGINFSGNVEIDNDAISTDLEDTVYSQGGRVKLQIDGRRDMGDYFVSAKGEVLAKVDGTTVTEDSWLMIGKTGVYNVRIGHYENTHLFPEGRDTIIEHATDGGSGNAPVPYEADSVRGRFSGGVRLRIQSVENWLIELGSQYGGGDGEEVFGGVRPVVVYNDGNIDLRLGFETRDDGVDDLSGFGVSFGSSVGDVGYIINLTELDDEENDRESTTIGASISIGEFVLGAYVVDTDYDAGNDPELTTVYASYRQQIAQIDTLYVTYAMSTSSSDDVAADADDQVDAVRIRLNYEF